MAPAHAAGLPDIRDHHVGFHRLRLVLRKIELRAFRNAVTLRVITTGLNSLRVDINPDCFCRPQLQCGNRRCRSRSRNQSPFFR